jgi:predicted nucleic acid-binding protein
VGPRDLKAAVDAGPLIHSSEISCLNFLDNFNELHVPDAVWLETVGQARVSSTELSNLKKIQRHLFPAKKVKEFVHQNQLSQLHAGERECLLVCATKNIPILLTDDMVVRRAARLLDREGE